MRSHNSSNCFRFPKLSPLKETSYSKVSVRAVEQLTIMELIFPTLGTSAYILAVIFYWNHCVNSAFDSIGDNLVIHNFSRMKCSTNRLCIPLTSIIPVIINEREKSTSQNRLDDVWFFVSDAKLSINLSRDSLKSVKVRWRKKLSFLLHVCFLIIFVQFYGKLPLRDYLKGLAEQC